MLTFLVAACNSPNEYLEAESKVQVLQKPYPLNFPSTKPINNKVIKILMPQDRVKLLDQNFQKDFMVYEVELDTGDIGYIISGSAVKHVK